MMWVAAAAGGALGSLARHIVNQAFALVVTRPSPWATASVNLLGSGIIGVLAGLSASGRLSMSPTWRVFLQVGILGGFTTFSSFMLDTLTLSQSGDTGMAFANVAGQLFVGFAAVWFGYWLAVTIR